MANTTVFLRRAQPADGSATYAQGDSSQLGSSYLGGSSSTSGSTEATGMQIIRRSVEDADIPPYVTNVIMHSWRHSTRKQYDHYIVKWVQFCSQGTCDPLRPTVKGIFMFLHSLYRKVWAIRLLIQLGLQFRILVLILDRIQIMYLSVNIFWFPNTSRACFMKLNQFRNIVLFGRSILC